VSHQYAQHDGNQSARARSNNHVEHFAWLDPFLRVSFWLDAVHQSIKDVQRGKPSYTPTIFAKVSAGLSKNEMLPRSAHLDTVHEAAR
jgi:hypothetical protein